MCATCGVGDQKPLSTSGSQQGKIPVLLLQLCTTNVTHGSMFCERVQSVIFHTVFNGKVCVSGRRSKALPDCQFFNNNN